LARVRTALFDAGFLKQAIGSFRIGFTSLPEIEAGRRTLLLFHVSGPICQRSNAIRNCRNSARISVIDQFVRDLDAVRSRRRPPRHR
jgi:hypothetical protein